MPRPSNKPGYQGASRSFDEVKVVRVPCIASSLLRGTSSSKDQRFVNGYFDVFENKESKNKESKKKHYYFAKRPGLTQTGGLRPATGNATARGFYAWNSKIYSVYNNKIYSNTTDLGVTLTASSGICGFEETRTGVTPAYLGINDGTKLYLISASDVVTTISTQTSTVTISNAAPAVVTWNAHGLSIGMGIRFTTTGTLPAGVTAGQLYYIITAGFGANSFEISDTKGGTAINTTSAGAGTHTATANYFPSPNTTDLVYMDGSWFVVDTATGTLWQSQIDDPVIWDTAKFITPLQYNGVTKGIAHQSNIMVALSGISMAMFYDNANSSGSILTLYEQAAQGIGLASQSSLVSDEVNVMWVSNSNTGGYSVCKMEGISAYQNVSPPDLERVLNAEGASISSCYAFTMRSSGRFFYILNLTSSNRTFVYDMEENFWVEWESAAGGSVWPILMTRQSANVLLAQHLTNGWIYVCTPTVFQDDSVSFTVLWRSDRVDFDTDLRKFLKQVSLIGDIQSTTTNTLFQYSDDDFTTLSTARTFDMSQTHPFDSNFGNFRRRSFQLSYAGANAWRFEALEFKVRLGQQ